MRVVLGDKDCANLAREDLEQVFSPVHNWARAEWKEQGCRIGRPESHSALSTMTARDAFGVNTPSHGLGMIALEQLEYMLGKHIGTGTNRKMTQQRR